jgi:hypothetical protein
MVIVFLVLCQREYLFFASSLPINTHSENWLPFSFLYGALFKNPLIPDATADNQYDYLDIGLAFQSFANWNRDNDNCRSFMVC